MKSMKVLIPLIFVLAMLFPMALLAQEATPEAGTPLSIMQALELVRAAYGTDAVITEISFYNDAEDDDEFQTACWHFEFADGTELCVDAFTGAIVVDELEAEDTPEAEATEDSNDDSNDDSSDDSNDDSQDDNSDDTVLTPLISLEEAIAIALSIYPDSVVTNADLEVLEDGTVVWDIELDNDVRSVDVDANTGAVLDFGYEEDDDNGYAEEDDSNDDGEDVNDDSQDDSNDDDEDVNDDDGEDVNDDSDDDSNDDSDDDSNDDDSSDDSEDD